MSLGEEYVPSRVALKDLNYMGYMLVCYVFVLYVCIALRIVIKFDNVSVYTPFTLFSVVEIEIL